MCRYERILQAFCKEAVMWKYLKHQNILPLIGVSTSPIQLISKWMPGGNLSEYIGEHPEADRVRLVGVIPAMITPRLTIATSYSKLQRASPTSMPRGGPRGS